MRPDSMRSRRGSVFASALLATTVVIASASSWKELSGSQKALIQPALQSQGGDFDKLPEYRRAALIKGADRWLAMTPAQRTTATQQFQQWQVLSPAEKQALLDRRERFRKLSDGEQKALLDTQKQFLEMPLEQQQQLQQEFDEFTRQIDGVSGQPLGPSTSTPTDGTPPLSLPLGGLPSGSGGVINQVPMLPR